VDQASYRVFPRRKSLWEGLGNLMGRAGASSKALEGLQTLMDLPGIRGLLRAVSEAPRGQVELRATGLPQDK
jgi:hypothetical protein